MRVLVTGGAGFIGSHTADALLAEGHDVRILDNLAAPVHREHVLPPYVSRDVEWIDGDVRDRAAWDRAVRGVEAIFHLAAYQDYLVNYARFFEVNVVSVGHMYEALAATHADVGRVVYASSQAVYGDGLYRCPTGHVEPFTAPGRTEASLAAGDWDVHCPACGCECLPVWAEESQAHPQNAYALSKRAGEESTLVLGARDRIEATALRYSIVQGPRQSPWNAYSGALRIFAQRARAGVPAVCYEDGQQLRDYTNIADVVSANLVALRHPAAPGSAFNVGGGKAVTVLELAQAVTAATGSEVPPELPGMYRVGDSRHSLSNTARLEALGWHASVPMAESVAQYVEWLGGIDVPLDVVTDADRHMRADGVTKTVTNSARAEK